jgi:hypothetical protein
MEDKDVTLRESTLVSIVRDAKARERIRLRKAIAPALRRLRTARDKFSGQSVWLELTLPIKAIDSATRAPRRRKAGGKDGT